MDKKVKLLVCGIIGVIWFFMDLPLSVVALLVGIVAIFWSLFLYQFEFSKSRVAEQLAFIERAKALPLPTSFVAFSRFSRISVEDILRVERVAWEIGSMVEQGKTKYTSTQFYSWLGFARDFLWNLQLIQKYPIRFCIFAVLTVPMGLIPLVIFAAYLLLLWHGTSRLEMVLMEFYNGTLLALKSASTLPTASGKVDDLQKLHELLKVGAITQAEFDAEKKRILA